MSTPFDQLEVLCELLVDFENLKDNGIDLTPELKHQGWLIYFNRLYGPTYTNMVKELWRFAYCDDHYIVSHVLGVMVVITEKSIVALLNMEKTGGKGFTTSILGLSTCPSKSSPPYFPRTLKDEHPQKIKSSTRI